MVKIIIDDKPENLCILVPDKTGQEEFSCFITDIIPDLHVVKNTQAFPMYIPDPPPKPKNESHALKQLQTTWENGNK